MSERQVQVLGAGGHAKVVIATLQASGYDVVAVFDDAAERWGTSCLGVPIRGAIDEAGELPSVLAIGDNRARRRLAQRPRPWISVVHPGAHVHASAAIGPGAVVFAGAVIQPDARIGAHAIINTAASVDHDCAVGDFVHLGPGVRLCGNVVVDEGALIGVGACARPGVVIGAWAIVGAGAAVVSKVAAETTVVGVPARALSREER